MVGLMQYMPAILTIEEAAQVQVFINEPMQKRGITAEPQWELHDLCVEPSCTRTTEEVEPPTTPLNHLASPCRSGHNWPVKIQTMRKSFAPCLRSQFFRLQLLVTATGAKSVLLPPHV